MGSGGDHTTNPYSARDAETPGGARGAGFVLARLGAFARAFIGAAGPARMGGAGVLVLLSAASEGIGLALLVPLVALLGEAGAGSGRMAAAARAVLGAVGLPLSLPVLLAVFIGLIALRALLVAWRDTVLERLEVNFVDGRRRMLFRAIAGASWSFLARRRFSDLLETLTTQMGQFEHGTYFFLRLPALATLAAAQLAIAFALSPPLTFGVLLWGALLFAVFHWRFGSGYEEGQRLSAARRSAFAEVSDFFHALKLAKSHGAEARHISAFESAVAWQSSEAARLIKTTIAMRLTVQIAAALTLGVLVFVAVEVLQIPIASVLVLILIFSRLTPLIAEFQTGWQAIVRTLPVFDAQQDLQARCAAAAEPRSTQAGRLELRSKIEFSGVAFRYDEAGAPQALRGLSFEIKAGSTVAIVGRTGAGKSTLADLLLGLITPTAGAIAVDGAPLRGDLLARWRGGIGYVPQDNFLFNASVRENLLWSAPDAGEDEITGVLREAAAADFVAALPQALDTVVGERGVRLSGGERQRLGLARALLRRPTLLVLDEATSALDSETERAVQAALERLHGSRTIVIIAHRLATVRAADRIFVLEGGELLQAGNWDELSRDRQGRFAALLEAGEVRS